MSRSGKSLSIAVPTFNRAPFLDRFIEEHAYCIEKYGVPVIMLDNASDDGTDEIISKHRLRLAGLMGYRNERTIPPDENFEKALKSCETEYVWLLGDTYLVPEETLLAVRSALEEAAYDLIVVNASGRVSGLSEKVYTDRNELLSDLGWHMTCLSTLVYSRELIAHADFPRYRDTNFLHAGIIFERLSEKPFRVRWIPGKSVMELRVPGVTKTSWESITLELWTRRWANFVFSLPPSYVLDAKLKCIMDHGVKSGLFATSSLKRMRVDDILNPRSFTEYSRYFGLTIDRSWLFMWLISVLPRCIFKKRRAR